jgi:hypothetical protein
MIRTPLTAVAVATLAAACALAAPASSARAAARACQQAGYSYAGIQTLAPLRGLSARLTTVRASQVTSGHVAAWVGVGGAGQGANGADEWLQVGIAALPGGASELYYEVTQPGSQTAYTSLAPVAVGDSHVVAIVETAPNAWVVRVDGQQASPAFWLPGSHNAWSPMATSESYDGGVTGCNAYSFQFSELKTSTAVGQWQPIGKVSSFHDAGHTLTSPAPATIVVNRR